VKLERDGDTLVSTPIYIGRDEDIRQAVRCEHYFESRGEPEAGPEGKTMLQREYCRLCVGMRVRITPAAGVSVKEFLEVLREP
jgi:hypothetical protein